MTAVAFVLAAALGAALRHHTEVWACSWQRLLAVNTAGAGILGWLTAGDVGDATLTVLGVGFCGALTTLSSVALEVRTLGLRWGAAYAGLTVASVCAAASIGASV